MGLLEELEKVGIDTDNYAVITGGDEVRITPFRSNCKDDYLKILTLYQRGWIFEYLHPLKMEEVEDLPTEFLIGNSIWSLHKINEELQNG